MSNWELLKLRHFKNSESTKILFEMEPLWNFTNPYEEVFLGLEIFLRLHL